MNKSNIFTTLFVILLPIVALALIYATLNHKTGTINLYKIYSYICTFKITSFADTISNFKNELSSISTNIVIENVTGISNLDSFFNVFTSFFQFIGNTCQFFVSFVKLIFSILYDVLESISYTISFIVGFNDNIFA